MEDWWLHQTQPPISLPQDQRRQTDLFSFFSWFLLPHEYVLIYSKQFGTDLCRYYVDVLCSYVLFKKPMWKIQVGLYIEYWTQFDLLWAKTRKTWCTGFRLKSPNCRICYIMDLYQWTCMCIRLSNSPKIRWSNLLQGVLLEHSLLHLMNLYLNRIFIFSHISTIMLFSIILVVFFLFCCLCFHDAAFQ